MLYAPAAEPLLAYLDAEEAAVRQAAARNIRAIGSDGVAKAVAGQLGHNDLAVRRELARALEIMMPGGLAKGVAEEVADANQDENVRVVPHRCASVPCPPPRSRATRSSECWRATRPPRCAAAPPMRWGAIAEEGDANLLIGLFEREPEVFAAERLAFTLNRLTRINVKIEGDSPR